MHVGGADVYVLLWPSRPKSLRVQLGFDVKEYDYDVAEDCSSSRAVNRHRICTTAMRRKIWTPVATTTRVQLVIQRCANLFLLNTTSCARQTVDAQALLVRSTELLV